MQQAFQVLVDLDKGAEAGQLGDLAFDDLAGMETGGDVRRPRIGGQLFEPQGHPLAFLVHA